MKNYKELNQIVLMGDIVSKLKRECIILGDRTCCVITFKIRVENSVIKVATERFEDFDILNSMKAIAIKGKLMNDIVEIINYYKLED